MMASISQAEYGFVKQIHGYQPPKSVMWSDLMSDLEGFRAGMKWVIWLIGECALMGRELLLSLKLASYCNVVL